MVEERKRFQVSGAIEEEDASTFRIVMGFLATIVVTLLLIPFLFLGACMGIFGGGAAGGWIAAAVVVVFLLLLLAAKTKNPGIKWGIILILSIATILVVGFAIPILIR